jgi:hypothetical protein
MWSGEANDALDELGREVEEEHREEGEGKIGSGWRRVCEYMRAFWLYCSGRLNCLCGCEWGEGRRKRERRGGEDCPLVSHSLFHLLLKQTAESYQ